MKEAGKSRRSSRKDALIQAANTPQYEVASASLIASIFARRYAEVPTPPGAAPNQEDGGPDEGGAAKRRRTRR